MWAMWYFFKLDIEGTIMPVYTDAMALVTGITDLVTAISTDDADGDGDVDADDAEYIQNLLSDFAASLTSVMSAIDGIIAIFTWPLLAGLALNSFNGISNYWPVVLFSATIDGGD
jgi:hypothetical protein